MISYELDFHAPASRAEALDLLAENGEDITILAGGMSLLPMMNLGLVKPEVVVSLNHVADLDYVGEEDGWVRVGATVRHVDVGDHPTVRKWCPMVGQAAASLGDKQVRNRGTFGGSVAHAIPGADYPTILSAVGGEIRLDTATSSRRVTPEEFFLGMMYTSREPSELVTEIRIPKLRPGWARTYRRFTRTEGGIPIVNAAAQLSPDGSGVVVVGGVVPRPVMVEVPAFDFGDAAELLEDIEGAVSRAVHGVASDLDADVDHKVAMGGVFARRAVDDCISQLGRGRDAVEGGAR